MNRRPPLEPIYRTILAVLVALLGTGLVLGFLLGTAA